MLRINKSIVLTALEPSARHSQAAFVQAVDVLRAHGVNTIEYVSPLNEAAVRGRVLAERGLRGIFLAASYQKENKQNLSSTNQKTRAHALEEAKKYIDAAILSGAAGVLITSGSYPDNSEAEQGAWTALEDSLFCLITHCGKNIRLLLEPGDRTVDAKQLAGPTQEVVRLMKRMNQPLHIFGLTMDTSHLAQLGEKALPSLALCEPWCDHVHLANCVLQPDSPLYGDKHPLFSHPDAVYTDSELEGIFRHLGSGSAHDEMTIALEIISRDADAGEVLHQVLRDERWFFSEPSAGD